VNDTGFDTTVETISPSTAAVYLATNTENQRRLQGTLVAKYRSDLLARRWSLTGEAIKFDTNGALVDGQHRLTALVQAGKQDPYVKLRTLVVRGLAPEVMADLDQGAARTLSDHFTIIGATPTGTTAFVVASVTRITHAWMFGRWTPKQRASKPELREWFDDQKDHILAASVTATSAKSRGLDSLFQSVTGGLVWGALHAGHPLDVPRDWLLALANFQTTGEGDPKRALLSRMARRKTGNEDLTDRDLLHMTVHAFNADLAGRRVHKLQIPRSDRTNPVVVPTITPPRGVS
jgi:hypothetical protein